MDSISIDPITQCWVWQKSAVAPNKRYPELKYGRISFKGTTDYTHRVAYILFVSNIPEGYVIDHVCRHSLCCNPAHLEAVTQRENIYRSPIHIVHGDNQGQRKFEWGTPCRRGHIRTPATVYTNEKTNKHQCAVCVKLGRKPKL